MRLHRLDYFLRCDHPEATLLFSNARFQVAPFASNIAVKDFMMVTEREPLTR